MSALLHLSVAIVVVPECENCGPPLPIWQQVLLSLFATALGLAIVFGLFRLFMRRGRRRDARLEACILGVQRAWGSRTVAGFDSFVTDSLRKGLRNQLARLADEGRVSHYEDPEVTYLLVVDGGGKRDEDCVALVNFTVRGWVTDATTGALLEGSEDPTQRAAYWRFVRDPVHGWLVDAIDVPKPIRRPWGRKPRGTEPAAANGRPGERFETVAVNKEERYALEIEPGTGKYCISFPVSNGLVEYNEHYEIDQSTFERFRADLNSAHDFVKRCKAQEMDDRLIDRPGTKRGTAN